MAKGDTSGGSFPLRTAAAVVVGSLLVLYCGWRVGVPQQFWQCDEMVTVKDGNHFSTLNANQSASTEFPLDPNQSASTELTLDPNQSASTELTLDPNQSASTELTLDPNQSASTELTLDPNQSASTELTLDPNQSASTELTLDPNQSASTELTLDPNQSASTELTLDPKQSASTELTLDPKQSASTELTLDPKQSASTELTLDPKQSTSTEPLEAGDVYGKLDNTTKSVKSGDAEITEAESLISMTPGMTSSSAATSMAAGLTEAESLISMTPDMTSLAQAASIAAGYGHPLEVNMSEFSARNVRARQGSTANTRIWNMLQKESDTSSLYYNIDIEREIKESLIGGPLRRLDNFRNPCWVGKLPKGNPYRRNQFWNISESFQTLVSSNPDLKVRLKDRISGQGSRGRDSWRMRCLPLVFTLGVSKSGTTDVFTRLIHHHQVVPGPGENFYWDRCRTGDRVHFLADNTITRASLSDYVDLFDMAAEQIRRQWRRRGSQEYHGDVTVDPTASYLWLNVNWENIPANLGLAEPRVLLAHTLREFIPKAKFIIILRQPSSRLYSLYNMFDVDGTPDKFHSVVVDLLQGFHQCSLVTSVRACVYNDTMLYHSSLPGFRASFYHIFLTDWFKVFPREQFFIILAEDYYASRRPVLEKMFRFLELRDMSDEWYEIQENDEIINSETVRGPPAPPMLRETQQLLDLFFRPYDEHLSYLLEEPRYSSVWHPTLHR